MHRLSLIAGWLRPLARRRRAAMAIVAVLAFAGSLLLATRAGVQPPAVHDEFSYLLAADTFLHGRVTNPSPPAYRNLETDHVIVRPTYMSKYPPGQGMALALGRLVGGSAIVGVWLSVAVACAAIVWMLLAWVPASWALVGGFIAVSRFVFLGGDAWWSQRYWGGAVAAMGGALMLGAWRRLAKSGAARDARWLALGLLILANTRPFEGFMLSLPVLAMLLVPKGAPLRRWDVLRPLLMVMVPGVLAMAWYNHRITGHFWQLPHMAFQQQYTAAPQFLWQTPGRTPAYGNKEMARLFVAHELNVYKDRRHLSIYLTTLAERWSELWRFFYGLPLILTLCMLPWSLSDRWMRRAGLALLVLLMGLASCTWFFPHYVAPASALFVLFAVQGLRHLRTVRIGSWRLGRVVGPLLAIVVVVQVGRFVTHYKLPDDWAVQRESLLTNLKAKGGKHIVVVRYADWHSPHAEWVYNDAALSESPVIWARDLGAVPNRELLSGFPGRTAWTIEADELYPHLEPYR